MPEVEDYRLVAPFTLEELVDAANSILRARPEMHVTRRTVRYYVQAGLLPPPVGAPKYARYPFEHLVRLVLVRLLLGQGLRLEAIRRVVEDLADRGLAAMVSEVGLRLGDEPVYAASEFPKERLFCSSPPPHRLLRMFSHASRQPEEVPPARVGETKAPQESSEVFRRIPLTDKVSLEVSAEAEFPKDLEAALDALAKFLEDLRDTT